MTRLNARSAFAWMILAAVGLALGPPAAEGQFGKNKIRYDDFEWMIYHSTHFDVYYYKEEEALLEKVVSYAESAYDQLSQDFNYQIEEPTPLIFYQNHSDFEQNNIILNFIPEGTGAFASPVRNRMVLPVDLPGPELLQLILHELTHIFQYHMIFGGNLSKGVASTPPLWFMEGMASYMAKDEDARAKMYLRDAVVNDRLPPVTADFGGFFAYRFGHAVFDYIEERWGKEGVRDFMIETRNTLGGRVGRSLERAFGIDPEDFNADFRRWLRKKYLPELVASGEPGDFGRPFRRAPGPTSIQTSPAASPSGDLLVAFSTTAEAFSVIGAPQVDVFLYDTRQRKFLRNLTKGFDKDFQYFVAQELTMGRTHGRDIAFSPGGNQVAFFARKNEGRRLVLVDVLKGGVREAIAMDVEQQAAPAWSPDGRTIAFAGHRNGQFDIFTFDLETGEVGQITNDATYDAAPTYSPDGKSIVLSSVVGGYSKLFRIDLDDPSNRYPLTHGETNETDAVFSQSGKRLYYTSDRTGANNVYALDLDTGAISQHSDSVTGCFQPMPLEGATGSERLVFTCFWKGRFDLYLQDIDEPISEPVLIAEAGEVTEDVVATPDLPPFEPAIEVSIDDRNKDNYKGGKFFVENVGGGLGVSDDQTFISSAIITFSDFLGDRRILAAFQSVESFQNFNIIYSNLSRRWQWQAHLFDNRDFFIGRDARGQFRRGQTAFSQTGAIASINYPFNVGHRVEFGGGYMQREIGFQSFERVPADDVSFDTFLQLFPEVLLELEDILRGVPPEFQDQVRDEFLAELMATYEQLQADGATITIPVVFPRSDDFPILTAALVGDTTVATPWGLVSGRRWRLGANWAPDTDASGTLTTSLSLDFRQYIPLTRRANLAYRLVGFSSSGNFPNPIYFGGLDTIRGFEFRSLVGTQGFYSNLELRFPLIDQLATPIGNFGGLRARLFLDVGGAWFDDFQSFEFYDSELDRLDDAVASYGWGFTIRVFGLNLNWDFAKRTDLDRSFGGFDSSFWIGTRF